MRMMNLVLIVRRCASRPRRARSPSRKRRSRSRSGGKSLLYYLPLTIAERKGYFKNGRASMSRSSTFPAARRHCRRWSAAAPTWCRAHTSTRSTCRPKGSRSSRSRLQGRYNGIVLGMSKATAAHYKVARRIIKGIKVGVTAPGSSTHMAVQNLAVKAGLKPDDFSAIGRGRIRWRSRGDEARQHRCHLESRSRSLRSSRWTATSW